MTARLYALPRKLPALAMILFGMLLATACVDVEVSSEYREDLTASHAIQIQVQYVPADGEEAEDLEAILQDLEERTINAGLEFERTDEAGVVTARISGTTSEGEEAGAALNSLINATGINASPGVTAPFRGTFERETGAIGGSSYILDLEVDGELLAENIIIERLSTETLARHEDVSMHYIASFPGDVTETSGRRIDDQTVRWEIPFEGVTDLSATSRTGGAGSAALFIIAGVIVIIVILAIAGGFGWYFARRKRLSVTLGGAIHRLPGQQTITREGIWVARKVSGLTHRLRGSRSKPPES